MHLGFVDCKQNTICSTSSPLETVHQLSKVLSAIKFSYHPFFIYSSSRYLGKYKDLHVRLEFSEVFLQALIEVSYPFWDIGVQG